MAPNSLLNYQKEIIYLLQKEIRLWPQNLRRAGEKQFKKFLKYPSLEKIIFWPLIFEKIFKTKTKNKTLQQLSLINLSFCLSYWLYDRILDKEDSVSKLPLAQAFFFLSFKSFSQLPSEQRLWQLFFLMEEANYLEKSHKKAKSWLQGGNKSMGLALAPLWLNPSGEKEIKSFFRVYLSLKQINDDALDWQEDLKRKIETPVIQLLRRQVQETKNKKTLKNVFQNKTSPRIRAKLKNYYKQGKKIIMTESVFKNKKLALYLLDNYKNN